MFLRGTNAPSLQSIYFVINFLRGFCRPILPKICSHHLNAFLGLKFAIFSESKYIILSNTKYNMFFTNDGQMIEKEDINGYNRMVQAFILNAKEQ